MSNETKGPQPPAEAQPERYACNGPEGTFWTDDAAIANKLIGAAFDRDEWTVTDTQNPTGAAPPPSVPVGAEGHYHPCTSILIEGLKRLEGGSDVLEEWDRARVKVDTALAQQPAAAGEEIMVNAAHDVYTLPLQPSGLSSGPRFVVHVPGQPASPKRRPYNTSGSLSEYGILPECDAALAAQPGGSDNDR